MATATALKFLERVEREETLRQQLYISRPPDIYKLTEFARGKGFVVSADDLANALEQYQERFATGTILPLKQYLDGYKRLPSGSATEIVAVDTDDDGDIEEVQVAE